MDMIKSSILIVDDSAVVRRILSLALSKHTNFNIAGTATNGVEAIQFIKDKKPDLVLLDVEMPIMDGITALKEIRKFNPHIPIIIFSSLTQKGAATTIDALTNGASDYVAKPSNMADIEMAMQSIDQILIPKINSLLQRDVHNAISPQVIKPLAHQAATFQKQSDPLKKIHAVCIGVSTGGPAALNTLFKAWQRPFSVPIFIVQHMPPKFTDLLAQRLSEIGAIPVDEPYDGQEALPGRAYIAPGGMHMGLKRKGTQVFIEVHDGPLENSCRPSVDVLFRSAATVYGDHLLAVVLTGMGSDGMLGAAEIRKNHGYVIAQDENSSVVWGMPGAVIKANLAQKIISLDLVPGEIELMLRTP
jgi:two-component system chemotaxis response regulator CheB